MPSSDASPAPASRPTSALWSLGFRPFFLAAGAFAVVAVAVWTARFAGWIPATGYLANPYWHAHEMIFGYALAVMAGFIFTAVRNWTGEPTPTGGTLAAIVLLWLAGRVLVATPWPLAGAAADSAFALAVAGGIAVPLVASDNRRNLFFAALIVLLGGANLAFYLAAAGILNLPLPALLQLALDVIAFIMAVLAGRVVPMFTANAIRDAGPTRHPAVERAALAALVLLFLGDLFGVPPALQGAIAAAGAAAHGIRLALWRPARTLRHPLVWVLHAAYAWLVIYLLLRAFAAWGLVAPGLAVHALTVGGIGGLTLGMMTRVARGHTGRALEAGRIETLAYVLVNAAALTRVFVPLISPALYRDAVVVSGLLWCAAFAAFVACFWPILTRPRADGRPG